MVVIFDLTPEQLRIIEEPSNCVVIAKPGSGKTSILSHKIARVLPELPHYRGVIAISYTNKASDELKRRCLSSGMDRKGSFFGTIDKFFVSEIIIPFGGHVLGTPKREPEVVKLDEISELADDSGLVHLLDAAEYDELVARYIPLFCELFIEGKIGLEVFGFLASYIFNSSFSCRRYLKARFSHVFIDEYQDCGIWQHALFRKLVDLGLRGVAVGDLDQSIFG